MTDWLSASAMLLAGVIVGAMFLYAMRRRQASGTDLERADLEAKRDALIARLREAPDPALEIEAAEVLRKLDNVAPALLPARAGKSAGATPPPSQLKGFLWGAGSV